MMDNRPDVLVIGAGVADIPVFPASADMLGAGSTPVERIAMGVGGDAANEARVLARLGHAPALVSVLGQDAPGDFILRELNAAGVNTAAVLRRDGLDTAINIVLVREDGERGFITSRTGSLRRLGLRDILEGIGRLDLSSARVACLASMFVSPELTLEDTAALFDALKARGLILCADTTRRKNGETLAEAGAALSRLDYFFPNLEEAALLTGEADPDAAADALLACGVKHVALKLGGRGCLLKARGERHEIPAFPVGRPVDTTGAGDTFAATFIAALLEGRPFEACGRFANAAASLCVQTIGAAGGDWGRGDVEERQQATGNRQQSDCG